MGRQLSLSVAVFSAGEGYMEQIVMKPKGWLRPPRQARSIINAKELRALADSLIDIGFISPILAMPDGEVIAGDRRRQAAMLHDGITDVPVLIIHDIEHARDIRIRRVSENIQRVDISLWDKYVECRGFKEDEPDLAAKDIAALLHVDASSITRYLCLDHCIEAVRQAVRDERIGLKACYDISKAPAEDQPHLLVEALKGRKATKKKGEADAGTVPANSTATLVNVKIPLPGGKSILLKGEHAYAELAKTLRKAANHVEAALKQHVEPGDFDAFMLERVSEKASPVAAKRVKA